VRFGGLGERVLLREQLLDVRVVRVVHGRPQYKLTGRRARPYSS
jgi:hypothetical protein